MLISLQIAYIIVLTNLKKMYAPSLDPYIFQKLYPWLQDGGGLAKFISFQGYFTFLLTQVHPLKSITPISFIK